MEAYITGAPPVGRRHGRRIDSGISTSEFSLICAGLDELVTPFLGRRLLDDHRFNPPTC